MLAINEIYEDQNGGQYRLLRRSPDRQKFAIIPIMAGRAMPQLVSTRELIEHATKGLVRKVKASVGCQFSLQMSPADAALRNKRWSAIEGLVADWRLYERAERNKLILSHALAHGHCPDYIRTCLHMFWSGGQTKDALIGRYHACGTYQGNSSYRNPGAAPTEILDQPRPQRGKKPQIESYQPYALTLREEEQLAQLLKKLVRNEKVPKSAQALYDEVCEEMFSYVDKDGVERWKPLGERPTIHQFRRRFAVLFTTRARGVRTHGAKDYDNNLSPTLGSILEQCLGPGHVYEIDSTIVDLWLVSSANRHIIIGKATLYLIVDRFSRAIVGFHLSLEKPSWEGAKEAILTLLEDKEELCKRWGAGYIAEAWEGSGLMPAAICADRGSEYLGKDSDRLCDEAEVDVVNAPAYLAKRKGMVELSFKLMHVELKEGAPGYEPDHNAKRRAKEKCYEQDAQLTLKELGAEILEACQVRNLTLYPKMELPPHLAVKKIPRIPAVVYREMAQESIGLLTKYDYDRMRYALMRRGNAKITEHGVEFKGLYYTCALAQKQQWFEGAPRTRFKELRVSYDSRSTQHIYLHDPKGPKGFLTLHLTSACEHYGLYSFAEAHTMLPKPTMTESSRVEQRSNVKKRFAASKEARQQTASEETKAAKKLAGSASRKRNSKEARKVDVEKERSELSVLDDGMQENPFGLEVDDSPAAIDGTADLVELGSSLWASPNTSPSPSSTAESSEPTNVDSLLNELLLL